jgi:hypothetical protein
MHYLLNNLESQHKMLLVNNQKHFPFKYHKIFAFNAIINIFLLKDGAFQHD